MTRALVLLCLCCVPAVAASSASPRAAPKGVHLIVYWSESPWPSIWSIRPDGTHRRRILRNTQNGKRPRLSPDRKWVAFDGAPPGKPPLSDFDIQIIRVDGSGRRTLTGSSLWDFDAQWSPDGQLLSFSRLPRNARDEHGASIWIIRRDGTGLHRVTTGFGARWSPDGTKLVYEGPARRGASNLSVIGLDGSDPHPISTAPGTEQPAGWSPDGSRILFTRYDAAGRPSIFVVDADGANLRRLGQGIAAAWSPDGTEILYGSAFVSNLLVMNADGSGKHRLLRIAASEPDWG